MAASPSLVMRLPESWILGDAWHTTPGDVPEIGREAFRVCREELETVRRTRNSRSVLLHGAPGSGKTHLISRIRRDIEDRNQAAWLDSIFVYVRLQTSPGQIWRHIRRQFVQDILRRQNDGPSQLERIVFRSLAAPGSRGGVLDAWKRELAKVNATNGDALAKGLYAIVKYLDTHNAFRALDEEIFEHLDAPLSLDRAFEIVLQKLIRREHAGIAEAWLKGESLAEAELAKVGLAPTVDDEDPEGNAREAVFQLLRLIGPGTPVAICFDQIEALRSDVQDTGGFFAFGSAAAPLRDLPKNTLVVSCIQSQFAGILPGILGANYDRISERMLELPGVTKAQGKQLVEARGETWRDERFADLFASTGRATARAVIQRAAQPSPETLPDVWERYVDAALQNAANRNSDEILEHGLPLLFRILHEKGINRSASRDVQFTITGAGRALGVAVCNQRNSVALAARFRRLRNEFLPPQQIVIVRDPRLPIPATARKTHEHLRELTQAGARFLRPSPELLAAVDALRTLLSDAQAGDLVLNGETIAASTVEEWLKSHFPRDLESLAAELLENKPTGNVEMSERLLDLLSRHHLMRVTDAATELALREAVVARCAEQSNSGIGYLPGPPAVLFYVISGVQA